MGRASLNPLTSVVITIYFSVSSRRLCVIEISERTNLRDAGRLGGFPACLVLSYNRQSNVRDEIEDYDNNLKESDEAT